jgi:hypothetical protein
MKALYTAGLAVGGFVLVERLSRPGARGRTGKAIVVVSLAVIAMLAVLQLAGTGKDDMRAALLGSSWNQCPFRIAALSVPVFVAVFLAMRRLAPTNLPVAGGAAGLFSGALAATIYGLFCPETAAPFIAIWYTLGIAIPAVIGAVLGPRLLRWR